MEFFLKDNYLEEMDKENEKKYTLFSKKTLVHKSTHNILIYRNWNQSSI